MNTFLVISVLGMILLSLSIVGFVIYHQQKVFRYNNQLKNLEEEKQQMLLRASIQFQEEERNKIAADLHDDAGPLLATARLYLSENLVKQEKEKQLQSIKNVKQLIDDSIFLIRNLSHSLMPPTLKNFGLESGIKDMFVKVSGAGEIIASVRFHDSQVRLKPEQELLVFRVIQELINNILKHSNAKIIHLTQNINADNMYFRLHHDGHGIMQAEFEKLNKSAAGLGLKNITSRIKVLKGRIFFGIDSSKTYYKVTIEVPLEN